MNNMDLIQKIHSGGDNTCYSAILADWKNDQDHRKSEELLALLSKGLDLDTAIELLGIKLVSAKKLLKKSCDPVDHARPVQLCDRMLEHDEFLDMCRKLIKSGKEDVYFSLNSFYKLEKAGKNVRHINAFVLDFDFYKLDQYKWLEPIEFYNKHIKKKLTITPTAVLDSGRGLYVVYTFKHCSYHMDKLYRSIMKAFYTKFQDYGVDAGAMLLTQVIRLPGTINSKTNTEVTILEFNETSHTIQDFAPMLPWSRDEVKEHRVSRIKDQDHKTKTVKQKDISNRKPYFKAFFEDMKKLITMRNRKGSYEGYREQLLYLVRERAVWSGYTINESVELAKELNKIMHIPLTEYEVENSCRPSSGRAKSSLEKIIDKISITINEQKSLCVLKRKWLKKSLYAKRKRKLKLCNMTKKKQMMLERRTRVCELKNDQHLSNKEISDILNVDKATITRDIRYINRNPARFKILLKEYMDKMETAGETDEFKLQLTYQRQEQIKKWLAIAKTALDLLVREYETAVT